jgi:hypothetical protein
MSKFSKGTCDEMIGKGLERLEAKLNRLSKLEKQIAEANKIFAQKLKVTPYPESQATYTWYLTGNEIERLREILTGDETQT